MPKGEKEYHPYLEDGQILGSTSLILGSFPVYACTGPDNLIKQQIRKKNKTQRFFYGSFRSDFWNMYNNYIDIHLTIPIKGNLALESLALKKIAISDIIESCERNGYSANDSDLNKKVYNRNGIQKLIQTGVRKILCTSKGVLNALEKNVICPKRNPMGEMAPDLSIEFQNEFLLQVLGNSNIIKKPICKVFLIDGIQVKAIAIPSPGSPKRKLADFGYNGNDPSTYLNNYLQHSFNWLCQ